MSKYIMNIEADDIEEGFAFSQCKECEHRTYGEKSCKAFPSGIPIEVYDNIIKHDVFIPGDNGYKFKQKEDILYSCGKCDKLVDKLVNSGCNENPELKDISFGIYYCPECGTLLVASCPHPLVCLECKIR